MQLYRPSVDAETHVPTVVRLRTLYEQEQSIGYKPAFGDAPAVRLAEVVGSLRPHSSQPFRRELAGIRRFFRAVLARSGRRSDELRLERRVVGVGNVRKIGSDDVYPLGQRRK